jgi:Holliday junction resolvase-like predicted endonuclease
VRRKLELLNNIVSKRSVLNTRQQGWANESIVTGFLRSKGLSILESNCYIGRSGEIDIIAASYDLSTAVLREIVFVEVRSLGVLRSNAPIISKRKQQRLGKLARLWLHRHNYPEYEVFWRIDLILVLPKEKKLTWYKHVC